MPQKTAAEARWATRNNVSWTPLHEAAFRGHKDVVALLLANNANVDFENNDGKAPLHYAEAQGHRDVAKLLVDSQAATRTNLPPQPSARPLQLDFVVLSEKQILERLHRLQQDHFKAQGFRKQESINNLIDHFIPNLVAIKPQDSDRIFSTYVNSLRGPTRLQLHARQSIDDLREDLDTVLEDYSVHVDDHYSVAIASDNSLASIAAHNKGSANGRMLNVFVWREANRYRFIGTPGPYSDPPDLPNAQVDRASSKRPFHPKESSRAQDSEEAVAKHLDQKGDPEKRVQAELEAERRQRELWELARAKDRKVTEVERLEAEAVAKGDLLPRPSEPDVPADQSEGIFRALGLIWQREPAPRAMDLEEAKAYAEGLREGGCRAAQNAKTCASGVARDFKIRLVEFRVRQT
jgi:Ankyrin repeats (3 copies)